MVVRNIWSDVTSLQALKKVICEAGRPPLLLKMCFQPRRWSFITIKPPDLACGVQRSIAICISGMKTISFNSTSSFNFPPGYKGLENLFEER